MSVLGTFASYCSSRTRYILNFVRMILLTLPADSASEDIQKHDGMPVFLFTLSADATSEGRDKHDGMPTIFDSACRVHFKKY